MTLVGWTLVALWALVLLASARPTLRRLPAPSAVVPPYALWLPEGGEPPPLDPPPAVIGRGAEPPEEGPDRILVLGAGVAVPVDLPGRLVACGSDFVSVCPIPRGGPLGAAIERLHRDVANPLHVTDPRHPAGFADARCAWLRRNDLTLPGLGGEPLLRAGRARKAHGLPVDLRCGRTHEGQGVSAPARSLGAHRRGFDDLAGGDGAARAILVALPLALTVGPWLLLLDGEAAALGALAIGLGTAARGMTALREGFGHSLALLGWIFEPMMALGVVGAPRRPPPPFPALPPTPPPTLTGAKPIEGAAWLDAAAIPFLARRLGGSAPVMAQIYANAPTGRTALGRAIDRTVHASPAARAVRFRLLAVAQAARRRAPGRLLSVPSGSAPDAARVDAPEMVLVDPDPAARALARAACPRATVRDGVVEHAPEGPFDVILYVGLSEYLDDAQTVRHLQHLRGRLAPAGRLITTTTAEHPQRARMSRWLGWSTRTRTPEALAELLDVAGYVVETREGDPLGIQWVLSARPRPSA